MTERGSPAIDDVLTTPGAAGKAARGSAIRIAGYALGVMMMFASVPLLTRHLGVVGFGSYVTVLSLISIVSLLADAGLTIVGVREYASRDRRDRSRLIANILSVRLLIGLAGTLVALCFAVVVGYDRALIAGTALAGVGVLLFAIYQTYTIPLASDLRLGLVTVFDVLRQALTAGSVLFLVAAGAGVPAFLAIPIPVGIVMALVTALAIRQAGSLRPALDRVEGRVLLRATIPVAAASVLAALFYKIAVIMTSVLSGEEETGYFSASLRVVELIIPIASLITSAAFPLLVRAASGAANRFADGMQLLFEIGCILGAATAVILLVGAEPVMQFIGGDEFDPAVPVLQVQGLSIAGSFLFAVWAAGLLAISAERALVVATAVGVGTVVTLTAVLAPAYGAMGAAVATTLAQTLLAAVSGTLLMRGRELNLQFRVVPKIALASACALLVSLIDLPQVVLATLALVTYVSVLTVIGGVPSEMRQIARWRTTGEGRE